MEEIRVVNAMPISYFVASSWFSKAIVTPIVGFIYLGALGSFFWLNLIYSFAVAMGFPYVIIRLLD